MNEIDIYYQKTRISGGIILLNLIVMPPAGLILLIIRLIKPRNYRVNCKALKICGYFLIVFSLIVSFSMLSIPEDGINAFIFTNILWGCPGLYCLYKASRIKKFALEYVWLDTSVKLDFNETVNIDTDITYISYNAPNEQVTPKHKVVTCSSCGAKKQILEGAMEKCDYCEMPLQ